VLVGHSIGGMATSGAAERFAENIARLIYLAAFIPADGESLYTLVHPDLPPGAQPPEDSRWGLPAIGIDAEVARDIFYSDCSGEDQSFALARLRPQANAPRTAPVALTAGRFGAIPKAYVECLDDRAVSLNTQRRMWGRTPCDALVSLPGGHSPFFARPDELAGALISLI